MKTGSDIGGKPKSGMTPVGATRILRCLWVFVLIQHGVFVWMGIRVYLNPVEDELNPFHNFSPALAWVSFGALVLIPWAYWKRNQRYKANWQGSLVMPKGYVQGMSEIFAVLLLMAPVSFLGILSSQNSLLSAIPLFFTVVIHGANFPTGTPMKSMSPRLGHEAS